MSFGHKKLDVYRISIEYVSMAYELFEKLNGKKRHARDQLLRASQSIPLNIAEGNGKFSEADRNRFFGIARGSALECAAIQDVLFVGKAITKEEYQYGEKLLLRIVSMLSKMTKNSWSINEEMAYYDYGIDNDNDHDYDHECIA